MTRASNSSEPISLKWASELRGGHPKGVEWMINLYKVVDKLGQNLFPQSLFSESIQFDKNNHKYCLLQEYTEYESNLKSTNFFGMDEPNTELAVIDTESYQKKYLAPNGRVQFTENEYEINLTSWYTKEILKTGIFGARVSIDRVSKSCKVSLKEPESYPFLYLDSSNIESFFGRKLIDLDEILNIPEYSIEQIYEKFWQASSSIKVHPVHSKLFVVHNPSSSLKPALIETEMLNTLRVQTRK